MPTTLIPCLHAVLLLVAPAAQSSLVHPGPDGRLLYKPWSDRGDTIPDFSHCGYLGGGAQLPDLPVRETLSPAPGDQTARLQGALDRLAAFPADPNGFRGVLLLRKGRYELADTLRIRAGGIVLRGQGQGPDDTVLVATAARKYSLVDVGPTGKLRELPGTRRTVSDPYVPVGAKTFRLDSAAGLAVGDPIIIARHGNAAWIHALGMDKLNRGPDDPVVNWKPLTLEFQRVITRIDGLAVTVDAPITCAIDQQWGGGALYKYEWPGRIRHVGVENLRGESLHKGDTDEKHAWDLVHLGGVQDGWVRRVTARHFAYACVNVSAAAARVTIQDCQCLDPVSQVTGGRRYAFALAGQLTLVQRCLSTHGRHDFVMHARVPGPNVFLDCVAKDPRADSGPHHRWSTGTLYDNVTCGPLNVQNRGRSGTGHGWAGAQMVFWNCTATTLDCQRPPTAQNFAIGCVAKKSSGAGHHESPGQPVTPRSLYLRQLEDRLGPQAVKNLAGQ